jgi:hypothetical protein
LAKSCGVPTRPIAVSEAIRSSTGTRHRGHLVLEAEERPAQTRVHDAVEVVHVEVDQRTGRLEGCGIECAVKRAVASGGWRVTDHHPLPAPTGRRDGRCHSPAV